MRLLGSLTLLYLGSFSAFVSAELTYEEAKDKGNALSCLMENTQAGAEAYMETYKPGTAVASPYTAYSDLTKWGWQDSDNYPEGNYEGVLDNYLTTQLDMENEGGVPIEQTQTKSPLVVEGITYPPSGGRYANVYYPEEGLIIADENYGPRNNKKIAEDGQPYVKLQQWSDVVYLNWENQAGSDVSELKAVIRFSISNLGAQAVMNTVTGGAVIGGYKSPMKFESGSANYNALLGTPNGSGVAWLLINHKAQLGIKTIKSISLFRSKEPLGGDPVTNMAFEIVDWEDTSSTTSS
ncbi:hypothetical protein BO94DRAFT_546336 [Aspergillus sclerotioniger CBS 115572]|uniref:Uncharacterized protein n=1 Tax=Aspergillus sclerotioniger CBS 115572 TaxID=1450535 RepID=A0A317WKS7_9EURO|nr:hypothetical protein BO94DRAFT_546336 [Aspergillus sclerotioniger CBS 115572]PWY87094.1 hypothetical protein BO94DRAFT_546336 [Aspergillus sclerotioniger CBS 115572]